MEHKKRIEYISQRTEHFETLTGRNIEILIAESIGNQKKSLTLGGARPEMRKEFL